MSTPDTGDSMGDFLAALREGTHGSKLKRLDVGRMLATVPPPPRWAVEPLLVRGEVTLLFGREGRGKSLLSQIIAIALADPGALELISGLTATFGRVVTVDAENGEPLIHSRLHGAGLTDASNYIAFEARGLDLREQGDVDHLRAVIRKENPSVVVLDSLATLAPGVRENDSEAMSPLMQRVQRLARDTDTAVLLLHHASKGGDGSNFRGSGAIGAVPVMDVVLIAHEGDPDPQRRELRWGKVRVAARPDPLWIRILSGDGPLRIEQAEPFRQTRTPSQGVQLTARMGALVIEHGELSRAELGERLGVDSGSGTFDRALKAAERNGVIVKVQRGRYGPPESLHGGEMDSEMESFSPSSQLLRGADGWRDGRDASQSAEVEQ